MRGSAPRPQKRYLCTMSAAQTLKYQDGMAELKQQIEMGEITTKNDARTWATAWIEKQKTK